MRLQDVSVVELANRDRFYDDVVDPETHQVSRVWKNEERVHRYYDFGPSANGHEEHVTMRVEEFSCGQHEEYTDGCDTCHEVVFGPPDDPEKGIAAHLRKSRGIELEP